MNPPANQSGIDTSQYQGMIDADALYNNTAFWLIKATGADDGLYTDSQFENSRNAARRLGFPRGYYHFAGATDADDEADLFTNHLGAPQTGEWLVLDWEVEYSDPPRWCTDWFVRVQQNTAAGNMGILYIDIDRLRRYNWQPLLDMGVHIWVANPDNIAVPYNYIMQQYGEGTRPGISGAVDLDFFHLDMGQFGSFGWQPVQAPTLEPTPEPVPEPAPEPTPEPIPEPLPEPTPKPPVTVPDLSWIEQLINWLKRLFSRQG